MVRRPVGRPLCLLCMQATPEDDFRNKHAATLEDAFKKKPAVCEDDEDVSQYGPSSRQEIL